MIITQIEEHGHAVAKAAGTSYNPAVDRVIARVDDDGELLGAVIYTNYSVESIGCHVAGFVDHWLNRDMLWAVFDYPFNFLGCKRVFGQIPETNVKSLEFHRKIGLKEVARIPGVFSDGGVVVVKMERDECKWLKLKPTSTRRIEEMA